MSQILPIRRSRLVLKGWTLIEATDDISSCSPPGFCLVLVFIQMFNTPLLHDDRATLRPRQIQYSRYHPMSHAHTKCDIPPDFQPQRDLPPRTPTLQRRHVWYLVHSERLVHLTSTIVTNPNSTAMQSTDLLSRVNSRKAPPSWGSLALLLKYRRTLPN